MEIVLGALIGLGLLLIVLGARRPPVRPKVHVRNKKGNGTTGDRSPGRLARRAAGKIQADLHAKLHLNQDATIMGRNLETHALHKVVGLVLGTVLTAILAMVFGALIDLPILMTGAVSLVGGLLGWWLPDSILKSAAEKERILFQQVTESWLELAAQLVTAGSDTFAALSTAASYSSQPGFVLIRDTLMMSAASGEPPWTGLRRLSDERRLPFLDPFCSSLELAGTTGAGSRQAILAQVDSARSKAMLEADAAAASSSEKMGAPLALIGGAFMVLMGYPPLAGILDSASLGGL